LQNEAHDDGKRVSLVRIERLDHLRANLGHDAIRQAHAAYDTVERQKKKMGL
jgi:hypothetical protein